MLCRKLRQAIIARPPLKNTVSYNLVNYRYFSRRCLLDNILAAVAKSERCKMSTFRIVFKDLSVKRLWSVWTRSFLVNNVFKRIKRDRSVREVIQCFRQTVLRPRRTLLLSTTAAFKSSEGDSESPPSCEQSITDDELEALAHDLETVVELSRTTLFCSRCGKRMVIDKKLSGVRYCVCKDSQAIQESFDGWLPYMEAEDVIIWRKEYKPGQGLYAYKVYGRYKDVAASDFAAVQVDGAYRRVWDAAVAALSVVERNAGGRPDQAVLHWEVLWPRLFANRDYVYIRRHKHFDVQGPAPLPIKEALLQGPSIAPPVAPPTAPPVAPPTAPSVAPPTTLPVAPPTTPLVAPPQGVVPAVEEERPCVHSNAKRKAMENEAREKEKGDVQENKVFVIISRSCEHPEVPESKNAIRVTEYWSNMVVRSTEGVDKPGMEFVLTYYDEPAVGGMPSGVASWATGRAAPAYLERMRRAANDYGEWRCVRENQCYGKHMCYDVVKQMVCMSMYVPAYLERMRRAANDYGEWRGVRENQELPDFVSFNQQQKRPSSRLNVNEEDIESSKVGPDLDTSNGEDSKRDQSTQTETDTAAGDRRTAPDNDDKHIVDMNQPSATEESKSNPSSKQEIQLIKKNQPSATEECKSNPSSKQEIQPIKKDETQLEGESDKTAEEDSNKTNAGYWWRYLYPLYYFS